MAGESPSWRRRLRGIIDHAARATSLLAILERRMRRRATLLMYHRVLPAAECEGYPFPSLVMPAEAFEQQVAWLAKHAEVVTAAEVMARRNSATAPTRRPVVAITFDDGYADNHAIAAPILDRHGVPATFFLASEFVGRDSLLWYDRAALLVVDNDDDLLIQAAGRCGMQPPLVEGPGGGRVAAWVELLKQTKPTTRSEWLAAVEAQAAPVERDRYRAMRPEDAADLARRGHEVASHSVRHEILPLLDDEALAVELQQSRRDITDWISEQVVGFCYPNGSYDDRVVAATRAAGYAYACTTEAPLHRGHGDALRMGRVDINASRVTDVRGRFDLVAFRAELCGLHEWLR